MLLTCSDPKTDHHSVHFPKEIQENMQYFTSKRNKRDKKKVWKKTYHFEKWNFSVDPFRFLDLNRWLKANNRSVNISHISPSYSLCFFIVSMYVATVSSAGSCNFTNFMKTLLPWNQPRSVKSQVVRMFLMHIQWLSKIWQYCDTELEYLHIQICCMFLYLCTSNC